MKDPAEFAVTIRLATDEELESTGTTDHANTVDGAALVLLGDEIIAVTNEYGTARIVKDGFIVGEYTEVRLPGGKLADWPTLEQIEVLVDIASNMWTPEVVGLEKAP